MARADILRELDGLEILKYTTRSGTQIIHDTRDDTYNRFNGTMLLRGGRKLVDSLSGKEIPGTSLDLYMYEGTEGGKDRYHIPEIGDVIIGGIPTSPQTLIYTSTPVTKIEALFGEERKNAIKDLEILYKDKFDVLIKEK